MERYEYWIVEAPRKKTNFTNFSKDDDPFAHTVMDAMNELARDGWQFLRTETLDEDRRSFVLGASQRRHRYMVYRRALRSNGMSLSEPVAPQRVRNAQPPNIDQLRERIAMVMSAPPPADSLQR